VAVETRHLRAVRNGLLAAATTAAVLIAFGAFAPGEGPPEAAPAPTASSPSPSCSASWKLVRSLNPDPAGSELHAVAAVSNGEAWAVGTSGPSDAPTTSLVERWDEHQWVLVAAPNDGAVNVLNGVTVAGRTDVWAVGRTSRGVENLPLIEHWDGTAWALSPAPTVPGGAVLNSVAAAGHTAWAVGFSGSADQGTQQALVITWDGTAWSKADLPTLPQPSTLSGAMARGPREAWAVGSVQGRPLVLRFNGTSWKRVDAPGKGSLSAIAPAAGGSAWAVGSSIQRWNGSKWIVVGRAGTSGRLSGIVPVSPHDVWAVGSRRGRHTKVVRAAVQRYDGSTWSAVPGKFLPHALLLGADATPGGTVWSVGYQDTATKRRAIVVRGSLACP
jgi:hypothetical protein